MLIRIRHEATGPEAGGRTGISTSPAAGMSMAMPTAMAMAMAVMCRAPARRNPTGSGGG